MEVGLSGHRVRAPTSKVRRTLSDPPGGGATIGMLWEQDAASPTDGRVPQQSKSLGKWMEQFGSRDLFLCVVYARNGYLDGVHCVHRVREARKNRHIEQHFKEFLRFDPVQ